MKLKGSHYSQDLPIYMNRQDRLAFESIGCYEGKEGQSLSQWRLVSCGCGRGVWRVHLGNYPRAGCDPCVKPQREEAELAITRM